MGVIGTIAMVLGMQIRTEWEPKTNLLPPDFVKTAQFLLNHGLADPRGCELRYARYDFYVPSEILYVGGRAQIGWIIPGQTTDRKQVITPYGIVVAARSVGSLSLTNRLIPRLPRGVNGQISDYLFLEDDTILGLFLMAIHGEEELVAKALHLISVASPEQSYYFSIGALAGYKFALYNTALRAYAKGDDVQAAAFCHRAIDDLAEFEMFVRELEQTKPNRSPSFPFSFFQEDMTVRKQILEREHLPARKNLSLFEIKMRPIDQQVSILIDLLSEVGNPKSPEFEGSSYTSNTINGRLIEIGQLAVPRLLDALANDDRMTRAQPLYMSGPSKQLPHFVSVKSVVRDILRTLAFAYNSRMTDEDIRSYWQKNQDKTEFQRIYQTLLDDSASLRWKYAALGLLQSDLKSNPYIRFQIGTSIEPQHIFVRPTMCDALLKASPSISDLMFNRLASSTRMIYSFEPELNGVDNLLTLALISYYIAPDQSLLGLKLASTKFLSSLSPKATQDYDFSTSHFAPVLEARRVLGDQSYISDLEMYATVLRSSPPTYSLEPAKYLIDRLRVPKIAKLTKSVFFDLESEYSVQRLAKSKPLYVGVIASELLTLPEGRAEAIRLLDDSTVVDSKIIENSTNHRRVYSNDGMYLRDEPIHSFETIRICDLVASALRRVKGCPEFNLDWPIQRRDGGRFKIQEFVKHLGFQKLIFKDRAWLNGIWL